MVEYSKKITLTLLGSFFLIICTTRGVWKYQNISHYKLTHWYLISQRICRKNTDNISYYKLIYWRNDIATYLWNEDQHPNTQIHRRGFYHCMEWKAFLHWFLFWKLRYRGFAPTKFSGHRAKYPPHTIWVKLELSPMGMTPKHCLHVRGFKPYIWYFMVPEPSNSQLEPILWVFPSLVSKALPEARWNWSLKQEESF